MRIASLRTELLVNFGVLVAAALLIAVTGALIFLWGGALQTPFGAAYLAALIIADVAIFVLFGAWRIRTLVLRPLNHAVAATEAIAAGDLGRRVPEGETTEFAALSASVNRMTERLLEEQHHLIRAEKLASVGRLAAGVAHEIGNPLGAVNGYAHILRRQLDGSSAAAMQALNAIEQETGRIDRIVRGLLDYARARRATPATIDLNDSAGSVVRLLESQGALRRVKVDLQLDRGCPTITGQRHDVEQVLVNLILNAVDAMDGKGQLRIISQCATVADLLTGGARRAGDEPLSIFQREPSPRVRAWIEAAEGPAGVAKLIVADSGPGVAPEDSERIFDPFYTTKEPGKGTGLGLAIVARIVENLRGVTWVQRSREGGAAFIVLFPLTGSGNPTGVEAQT